MAWQQRFSEIMKLLDSRYLNARSATLTGDKFLVTPYARVAAIIRVNEVSAGDSVIFSLQQSVGSGALKAIAGKAAVAVSAANDPQDICIELRTEELDLANGYNTVAVVATVAGDGGEDIDFNFMLFGYDARFSTGATEFDQVVD